MTKNIVFSQITNLISSSKMNDIHKMYGNQKYIKKFSCVDHFKVLILSQIKGFSSLREIEIGLKSRLNKLFHLDIRSNVKRSTLSDANNNRNPDAFKKMFFYLQQCKSLSPSHKFRFKNEFYSLTPGSILVMDRAYVDFKWLNELEEKGITFITRAKSNMNFKVTGRKPKLKSKGILKDNIVRLKGFYKSKEYPSDFRLIKYKNPKTGKVYQYITNNFNLAAKTIAECYKERWQIELFFEWIKQHLKIKKFIGNSEKAIHHQIWAALIYYLIVSFIKFKNKWSYSLLHISRVIRELIEKSVSLAEIFRPPDIICKQKAQTELFRPILTGH